jgi:hypothetical protein
MENQMKYETVDEFLKSDRLKRADVVLVGGKKSFISRMIKKATNSHWSHAALVFVIPHRQTGFENTFLIESIGDGVDITDLSYYLKEHAEEYDVGIRRLDHDWFSGDGKGLSIRKRVRGNMLNSIKAEYDFGAILQIGMMLLRKLIFGIRARLSGLEKTVSKTRAKGRRVPSQFICSGFVQYGFYNAIKSMIDKGELHDEKLREVIFNPHLNSDSGISDYEVMLSTTPENIAATDKLTWKYVIKNGKVYDVRSKNEVNDILKNP